MARYVCSCGNSRWRTVSKANGIYRCRICGQFYQNGRMVIREAKSSDNLVITKVETKPSWFSRIARAVKSLWRQ